MLKALMPVSGSTKVADMLAPGNRLPIDAIRPFGARLAQILDLFAADGQLEVRPPGAPTIQGCPNRSRPIPERRYPRLSPRPVC
jgi:hypothetical protein